MKRKCKTCCEDLKLFPGFDSNACIKCDKWIEKKCKDSECEFCSPRPDKPSGLNNDKLEHAKTP